MEQSPHIVIACRARSCTCILCAVRGHYIWSSRVERDFARALCAPFVKLWVVCKTSGSWPNSQRVTPVSRNGRNLISRNYLPVYLDCTTPKKWQNSSKSTAFELSESISSKHALTTRASTSLPKTVCTNSRISARSS